MHIKKDTILKINHIRKGQFTAIAERDFDTETTEWYPIVAAELVTGRSQNWEIGEHIACRAKFCTLCTIEKPGEKGR